MNLLFDTQLLLWVLLEPARLPRKAQVLLEDTRNRLIFSALSIWEIAVKQQQNRPHFVVNASSVHRQLLTSGYAQLDFTADHALATTTLPHLHKDPFDRGLLAQASFENFTLVTADRVLASYPGAVLKV